MTAPDAQTGSFRLVSYNVHIGGMRPDTITPYDLQAVFDTLGGDVVVTQEMFADSPRPRLPYIEEIVIAPPNFFQADNGQHPEYQLVVASRYPILARREFPLRPAGGDPRDKVLGVQLDTPGGHVWIIGVHLTTGALPYGSFRQVRDLAAQLPEGPLVIAGDHNLWGPACASGYLGTGLRRAVKGRTWPARFPHSQIDHIWTRGLNAREGRVHGDTGSDHRAVSAVLSLGTGASG